MSEALTSGTFRKKRLEDYFVNGYAKFNSFFDETMEGLILLPIHGEEIIVGNKGIVNRVFQKIKEQYDFESNVYQKTFFAESIFDESTSEYYFACVSPIYRENTTETVGYFISIINNDFINNIFKINQEKELDAVILLAENNKIITGNKEISHVAVEKVMKYINDYSKEEYISIENTDHLYFEKEIENTKILIFYTIPWNV